jgi:hypothetical protein
MKRQVISRSNSHFYPFMLKANLHRVLRWRFGPKSEAFNVDRFALFAGESVVIESGRW